MVYFSILWKQKKKKEFGWINSAIRLCNLVLLCGVPYHFTHRLSFIGTISGGFLFFTLNTISLIPKRPQFMYFGHTNIIYVGNAWMRKGYIDYKITETLLQFSITRCYFLFAWCACFFSRTAFCPRPLLLYFILVDFFFFGNFSVWFNFIVCVVSIYLIVVLPMNIWNLFFTLILIKIFIFILAS